MRWRRTARRRWRSAATDTSQSLASHVPWSPKCSASSARTHRRMADDAPVAEQPSAESQTCILIVDDHEDNIMVLKVRLESWGYRTASAYNGMDAITYVE